MTSTVSLTSSSRPFGARSKPSMLVACSVRRHCAGSSRSRLKPGLHLSTPQRLCSRSQELPELPPPLGTRFAWCKTSRLLPAWLTALRAALMPLPSLLSSTRGLLPRSRIPRRLLTMFTTALCTSHLWRLSLICSTHPTWASRTTAVASSFSLTRSAPTSSESYRMALPRRSAPGQPAASSGACLVPRPRDRRGYSCLELWTVSIYAVCDKTTASLGVFGHFGQISLASALAHFFWGAFRLDIIHTHTHSCTTSWEHEIFSLSLYLHYWLCEGWDTSS